MARRTGNVRATAKLFCMGNTGSSDRHIRLLAVIGMAVVCIFGWRIVTMHPPAYMRLTGPPPHPVSVAGTRDLPPTAGDEEHIWVYVRGEVVSPGPYRLPAGSAIQDAIDVAGGFTDDADPGAVPSAGALSAGEEIIIPASTNGGEDTTSHLIDINSACAEQLQELTGIGPVLAERITDHRRERGAFTSVDELLEVKGIGPVILENIRADATAR